ncbi:MAG: hypothetical protein ACRD21_00550 [Vicinamibacteria bacterium]
MGNFIGGSAYSMATQVAEGYLLLNHTHLKKLEKGDLALLTHELNRVLTEARGSQPPLEDVQAQQQRNRKISRLTGALTMVQHRMTQK